jgi:Sld7 C-terminal domain
MDSWDGHLQLPDARTVKDIHICSAHDGRPQPIPHDAMLAFTAVVELSAVPLHLVAGPSCCLWTDNPDTEAWFRDLLLREHPENGQPGSWFDMSSQSYAGILASVKSNEIALNSTITDILFFAVMEPGLGEDPEDRCLQVQAVPLACGPEAIPTPKSVGPQPTLFVSNGHSREKTQSQDIFDAATEIRRRSKGRGGIEVAAAAAGLSQARLLIGHKKAKVVQSQINNAVSQGESQFSAKAASQVEGVESQRLLARSSSLPNALSADQQISEPQLKSKDPVSLEQQNKDAISRLVMAGMRLHGYQPRKRKPKLTESATVEETQSFSSDDHKLVYHQTYKAVAFIFVSTVEFLRLY